MFDRLVSDSAVLGDKPCIKGTRVSVEFVLELVASGASRNDIVEAHPQLGGLQKAALPSYRAARRR